MLGKHYSVIFCVQIGRQMHAMHTTLCSFESRARYLKDISLFLQAIVYLFQSSETHRKRRTEKDGVHCSVFIQKIQLK